MIDFKKHLQKGEIEKRIDPRDIYNTIDRKSVTGPLRPTQNEILEKWYQDRKNDRDLIIKLHTGEGKTLIGLLILQSRINSNEGPCLYVCPNKYLVHQVCEEAEKFGINYCTIDKDNNVPNAFISGEKILITHAQKIFNGMSVFGLGVKSIKIGTIILDDSHACIDVISDALTITVNKNQNSRLYTELLSLFEDDLRDQGEGSLIDIQSGDYETLMAIPYWSWFDKKSEVLQLLAANRDDNQVKFTWSIIKDAIVNYEGYVTSSKFEISTQNPDLEWFGSFSNASHRILMSATTQNDAFFIKGLNFDVAAIKKPLNSTCQKWSGEKMIIIPSLIHDDLDRELMVSKLSNMPSPEFGIVALVPSTRKAAQYEHHDRAIVSNSENIYEEIDKLKKGDFHKVLVVNNRYDGIDLPDEACRILIFDSMPYFDRLSERYEEKCRPNSEEYNKKLAQKIEQGLGRGVRGEKDYCVVLLIGADIVKFVRNSNTLKFFSEQTKKEIDIGLSIVRMTREDGDLCGEPIQIVNSLINQSLRRDEGWKEFYIEEMNSITHDENKNEIHEKLLVERCVHQLHSKGETLQACDVLQKFINESVYDPLEKGWYFQQLAKYFYMIKKDKAASNQRVAFKLNTHLFKPREGIPYKKVSYIDENRLKRIRTYFRKFRDYSELHLSVLATLDNLSFGVESDKFEDALNEIGEMLGFICQRPDKDIRKGPDNLWCGLNDQYFMFECKNEVDINRNEITKTEAGQMNNHCGWFEEVYGKDAKVTRYMIIPTKSLSYSANFTHDVRIIRRNKLNNFKKNIKNFLSDISPYSLLELNDEKIIHLIDLHKLDDSHFQINYSEQYFHNKN